MSYFSTANQRGKEKALLRASYRKIFSLILILLFLLSIFSWLRIPRIAIAPSSTGPLVMNAGPADGTSVMEGENLTLFAEGYSDTGLDLAWLSTNETGTWNNYTQLWSPWQASGSNPIIDGDSLFGSGWQTEDSKVLKVEGTYYMAISSGPGVPGNSAPSSMQIYLLESPSLTGPWSVTNSDQPIIVQSVSGWDQGQLRVAGPMVHYEGIFYLYYMGTDASGVQSIGVATTSDAQFPGGWSKYDGNPILTPTGSGWESGGIYSFSIAPIGPPGNEWYAQYTGRTTSYTWAIGVCYGNSPYGPFTRYDNNPIVQGGGSGAWDSLGPARCDFIVIGNMIYGAYESATSGAPPNWDFQVGGYSGQITDNILDATFSKDPGNPIIPGNAGSALQTANPHWYYENGTRYLFVGACGQGNGPTWRYIDLFSSSSVPNSPIDLSDTANSWIWSNFTWSDPSVAPGNTIHWEIYYNDTNGNVNGTGIHSFTVTAPEYDYVDSNTSDVDGNGNKGTFSNFNNQKASDSNYDILTEENTGGLGTMEYRENVTISHSYATGNLTNFPVLLDIYDSNLHNHAQTSGNDIAFTDSSGTMLDYQIEYFNINYNSTDAHLVAWVKANLTSASDTTICMIYGNPTIESQQNPTGVWNSNFTGVWHMNETNAVDSTANGNNGTSSGGVYYDASGEIGGALTFDGSTGYVEIPNSASLNSSNISVEAWVYLNKAPTDLATIAIRYYTYYFTIDSSLHLENYLYTPGDSGWKISTAKVPLNTWTYVAFTYNGSVLSQFINGVDVNDYSVSGNVQPGGSTPAMWNLYFGAQYQSGPVRILSGTLDEMRISSIGRSAAWINASYLCENNQTSFRSIGTEETGSFGIPPNYELDLEIQWTNVNYTTTHRELCIKTGSFSDSEPLQVRVWNSTDNSWIPVMNLIANQWNNVSVTSYLTEPTFTVQFLQSGDASQHSWAIDCSLIHTWDDYASLQMSPTNKLCREYGEAFPVQVNVTDCLNMTGFRFEIHYNATLLNIMNISWDAWGIGTYNLDLTNGNLSGYTSGSPISGNMTLITITFNATFSHIWKAIPGWANDLAGTIFIQWANLSYPRSPDLGYIRAAMQNQITVGQDVSYTFSPIQGDINNDGTVDLFDLRAMSAYFGQQNPTYDLVGHATIDIYDLVVIASNFGYTYSP